MLYETLKTLRWVRASRALSICNHRKCSLPSAVKCPHRFYAQSNISWCLQSGIHVREASGIHWSWEICPQAGNHVHRYGNSVFTCAWCWESLVYWCWESSFHRKLLANVCQLLCEHRTCFLAITIIVIWIYYWMARRDHYIIYAKIHSKRATGNLLQNNKLHEPTIQYITVCKQ